MSHDTKAAPDNLPYRIEVRADGEAQLLAMARNAAVARAIFTAAVSDSPDRRVVIQHGGGIIAESRAMPETA